MTPDTLRKDDEGRWLCNVVEGCDEIATLQAPLPCPTGCDAAVEQHEQIITAKRQQLDDHERALEIVRLESERAAAEGASLELSTQERAAIRLGQENLTKLRADLEKLEAVRERIAAEHTHPVMACEKHEKKLEQLVAEHAA